MKIGALWGIWVEFFSCGLHSCRVRLTLKEDIEHTETGMPDITKWKKF